jgi:AraC-like DNA-binding protein
VSDGGLVGENTFIRPTPAADLSPRRYIPDFFFVPAEEPPVPEGLVWAHRLDSCLTAASEAESPELLLDLAVERWSRRHPEAVERAREERRVFAEWRAQQNARQRAWAETRRLLAERGRVETRARRVREERARREAEARLPDDVVRLRRKGYVVDAIAERLDVSRSRVRAILRDAGLSRSGYVGAAA